MKEWITSNMPFLFMIFCQAEKIFFFDATFLPLNESI